MNSPIFDVLLTAAILVLIYSFFHKSIVNILKDPKELFTIVAFWLVMGLLLFVVIDYFRSQ